MKLNFEYSMQHYKIYDLFITNKKHLLFYAIFNLIESTLFAICSLHIFSPFVLSESYWLRGQYKLHFLKYPWQAENRIELNEPKYQ